VSDCRELVKEVMGLNEGSEGDRGKEVKVVSELLGTLFDPCRLAYLTYTSND
jgi:hypothetical protein